MRRNKIMALQVCLKLFSLQLYLQVSTPNVFLINFEDGKSLSPFRRKEEEQEKFIWKALLRKLFLKTHCSCSKKYFPVVFRYLLQNIIIFRLKGDS